MMFSDVALFEFSFVLSSHSALGRIWLTPAYQRKKRGQDAIRILLHWLFESGLIPLFTLFIPVSYASVDS
jgi:RimJ/RimL family protein N-acetyltransferase